VLGGHHGDDALLERHQRLEVGDERRTKDQDEIDLVGRERLRELIMAASPGKETVQ
jgi:hypothetical protein